MPGKSTGDNEQSRKSGERVAKVIARAGFGSRRDAEEMITAGRVAVNGVTITSPALNVAASDTVTVDGKPLPERERTRLFLYHKPRGLVTTHHDPQGRPTVFAALPKHLPRLLSVGRLDYNTEGLLLLTNDGGLARVLERPETGWLRRYRVRAHGRVTQAQLDRLRGGVTIDGIRYGPIEGTLDREQGSNVWLTIGIREGKNREVRNVMEHLGLTVTRLIRVSFGPFQLGGLGEGEVEEVKTRVLRDQLGERIAKEAGADFSGPIIEREAETARPDRPAGRKAPELARAAAQRPPRDRDSRPQARRGESGREQRRPRRAETRRERHPAPGIDHAGAPRPPTRRAGSSHVWRQRDDFGERPPVKAKSRGGRKGARSAETTPRQIRAGLIADRKGRRVLVERVAAEKPERPPLPGVKRPGRGRRDRSSGPRPSRPHGRER